MAVLGFTAALQVNTGASQAFETIDEATMITLPSQETTSVETTYLGLADPYKTFVGGLTDSGVLAFEANYTKTWYNKLNGILGKVKHTDRIPANGPAVQWKVTAPDEDNSGSGTALVWTINGFLTKIETGFEVEGVVKMKGEVKVTGKITIA